MKLFSKLRRISARLKAICTRKPNCVTIAIYCDGGVGDGLVHLNYAKKLKEYTGDNVEIDFYFKPKITLKLYHPEDNYLHGSFAKSDLDQNFYGYDLILRMKERLPMIWHADWSRLQALNPKLVELARHYQSYSKRFSFFYDHSPRVDGFSQFLAMIQNGNRITQPDVGHKLGITGLDLKIRTQNDEKILKSFNLESGRFITFNRSVDNTSEYKDSTKLWPKRHYLELWEKVHDVHPNTKLVYIGPEAEDYVPDGILNLSGRTSFEELLVLLKHAKLHIGPEGGMIHMRHALCGLPSCVLFGPTSVAFYGYSENYNLETEDVCISSCEWLVQHWQSICLKTDEEVCKKLQALSPDTVFDVIEPHL
ncbi:MAG: hypothetical protein BHW61_01110 [Sutterella sp. 63_29]|jgi:ADP-heptose:LPS heptosyltransferase|nr:MAG: hypothetical protein BHW61_01110 [Sutterella sp. 63_29]